MTDELLEYPTTLSWTRGMTKKRRSVYERAEETDQVDQGTQKNADYRRDQHRITHCHCARYQEQ